MSPVSGVLAANPKVRALNSALVRLAADGVRPRCGEPDAHQLFLSEDPAERALAATWCTGCPLLAECAEAGAATRANFGVWGGRDRTIRPTSTGERGLPVPRHTAPSALVSTATLGAETVTDTPSDTSGPDGRSNRPSATTTTKEN